jgi:hypothetical protein
LIFAIIRNLILVLNQWSWIHSDANLVRHNPIVTTLAYQILIPFVTPCLCRSGFSVFFFLSKQKCRINYKLNVTCVWLSQKDCLELKCWLLVSINSVHAND